MAQGNLSLPIPLPYRLVSYKGGKLCLRMRPLPLYFRNFLTSVLPLFILVQFFRLLALPDYDKPEIKVQVLLVLVGLLTLFLLLRQRVIRRVIISAGGIELTGHQWGYLPVSEHFTWQDDDLTEIVYNGGRSSNCSFRLRRGGNVYPLFNVIGGLQSNTREAGRQMALIMEEVSGRKWVWVE